MKKKLSLKIRTVKIIYIVCILLSLLGIVNSAFALFFGFLFAYFFENPFQPYSHKAIHYILKTAVVGLGFGMLLNETLETSKTGFNLTLYSIIFTLSIGFILVKLLKLDKKLGFLIMSGTSICGGSAIAAISGVINAKSHVISIALGIVFLLNAIALFIFPSIGHLLNLTQHEFGLWCAISIHDTSSVIGSTIDYGEEALKVATTVKLSRTLWVIPLSLFSMFVFNTRGNKIKIPYFIVLFIIAIVINSSHILPNYLTSNIVIIAKRLLVLALFIVGSTLSIKSIKAIGIKPLLFASILWLFISIFSLTYILNVN